MQWTTDPPSARGLFILTIILALAFSVNVQARQNRNAVLRVAAVDESDKPVAGVSIEVKLKGAVVRTTTTNEKGEAAVPALVPGIYELVVSKDTFEPLTQSDIAFTAEADVEIRFTMIPKVQLKDVVVNIQARSETTIEKAASPGDQLDRAEVKNVASKPATVKDTLPLVPGVVRSTEGEIRISGSDEHRSALVVNAADVTDPATGQFGVTVPVDSVESIEVFKTPYLAQFGRFTAGVVSVETRRGGDKWNFELNDPLPEFRIKSGHLRGLKEASP